MPAFDAADLDAKRPVFGSKHFLNGLFSHGSPRNMNHFQPDVYRRTLQCSSLWVLTLFLLTSPLAADASRPKVAALITEFTYRSHAHVILENFLEHYYFNGELTDPGVDVVSFYVDQNPESGDMSGRVAREYGITIYPTIEAALCLGGDTLAVDGVLSIAEFGNYPRNEKGQILYPRKRFFDEIIAVFDRSGRSVPVFNDKHLSYRWDWAKEMVEAAKRHNAPLLAGSSVPLAQRRPPIDIPSGAKLKEAVAIHGGPLEIYDFHIMEVLQSLIEFRAGGETGVEKVEFLEGDAVWEAADNGRWSFELAEAAMLAELGEARPLRKFVEPLDGSARPSHATIVTYRDGLQATVIRIGSNDFRWNFACYVEGQTNPLATSYYVGPWRNRNLFKALSRAIQLHIVTGEAPYPAERTLLVTGMLDAMMESRHRGGAVIQTPQLHFSYRPKDFRAVREMGATWKIITEDMPEPKWIEPGGPRPSTPTKAPSHRSQ